MAVRPTYWARNGIVRKKPIVAAVVGADGYEATAPGAVGLARRLIGAD